MTEKIEKLGKIGGINLQSFRISDYSFIFSFLVLVMIAVAVNPNFLTYQNISTILLQASIVGIIGLGMTLIISSGQIDLSVGSIVALVGGMSVLVLNQTQNFFLTLLFCIVFGAFLGTINGLLVTVGRIAPFIVTLATMTAYRSIIVQLGQGGPFNVNSEILPSFRLIASGNFLGVPNLAVIFIIITALMWVLTTKLKFGRYIFAVGSNEHAAQLTGINVKFVKTACFTITGALCGISAFLLTSRLTSIAAANAGTAFELDAIAAVAIGGTVMSGGKGMIIGTFFGALMIQMIEGILIAANVPPFLTGLVKGIVIIVAVLLQTIKWKRK